MPNPTITFRANPYQLARGLWLIRQYEANFHPSSPSNIVKTLYLDVIAKHMINRPDPATPQLLEEIYGLLNNKKRAKTTLEDFLQVAAQPEMPAQPDESQSIITTVTDFSPPTDWLDEDNE